MRLPSALAPALLACSSAFLAYPTLPASAAALLRGEVRIATGQLAAPDAALYLTARTNRADDVPKAILSGTRGKPPPIAAKRLAPPLSFPLAFELDDLSDLTPEGAAEPARWWERDELVLSARLDADGVAATRDPTDLVGRAICASPASSRPPPTKPGAPPRCALELGGRGVGGRLITTRAP